MILSMRSASRAAIAAGVAALFSILFWCGCAANDARATGAFVRALPIPAGWERASDAGPSVPGKPIDAWKGPAETWLVAFRTLPDPRPAAASAIAAEWANRHRNLAGYRVRKEGAVRVREVEIARVDLSYAPAGTEGAAMIVSDRTYLGLPAKSGTYWLVWAYPEGQRTAMEDTIATFLKAWRPPDTPF